MSRKREKPYPLPREPYSLTKRRRPQRAPRPVDDSADAGGAGDRPESSITKAPATVMVIGLSPDCSMLDVKSRFEIYGSISRTTIQPGGVGYVTFRSKDSAESAIAAALDPSFGITLDSNRVQVMWASDPVPQWRKGVARKDGSNSSSSSKLLRAEVPLSRYGKGNKLGSMIVNPRGNSSESGLEVPFKGREIIAYDDIL